jgi:hypothetical protein
VTQTVFKAKDLAKLKPKRRTGWYRRSKATERTEDGITFSSKAELKRYRELKAAKARGIIRWFLRQPVFDLAGVVYRADFLVVSSSGAIVIEDVKGRGGPRGSLDRFRRDREQVKQLYGVDVILVEMD